MDKTLQGAEDEGAESVEEVQEALAVIEAECQTTAQLQAQGAGQERDEAGAC